MVTKVNKMQNPQSNNQKPQHNKKFHNAKTKSHTTMIKATTGVMPNYASKLIITSILA